MHAEKAVCFHQVKQVRRSVLGQRGGRQTETPSMARQGVRYLFQVASIVSSLRSQASTLGISCLNATIRAFDLSCDSPVAEWLAAESSTRARARPRVFCSCRNSIKPM